MFLGYLVPAALSLLALGAGSPRIDATLDKTRIFEGESVGYRVTLDQIEDNVRPTLDLEDFDSRLVADSPVRSQFTVIINGRRIEDRRHGRTLEYQLTPRKTGKLTIPGPTVVVNGRTIRGPDRVLTVIPPEEQDTVRLAISTEPVRIYPQQPFAVVLTIWVRSLDGLPENRDPARWQHFDRQLQIPWAEDRGLSAGIKATQTLDQWLGPKRAPGGIGFRINAIGSPPGLRAVLDSGMTFNLESRRVRRPDSSGRQRDYWQYRLSREFVASRAGKWTFGPASLRGRFLVPEIGGAGAVPEDFYAVARPVIVEIQDVPETGRPDSFTGAIGTFSVAAALTPTKAKVGDPLKLTIALKGKGVLDASGAPKLDKIAEIRDNFRVYEATEETKGGARLFSYLLRPKKAGSYDFPKVPIAYFDTTQEKYVTIETEPIPVEIAPASRVAPTDLAKEAPPAAAPLEPDQPVDESVEDLADDGGLLRPGALGGVVIALSAAYIGLLLLRSRKHKPADASDPAKLARDRMALARARAAKGEMPAAVEAARAALVGWIAHQARVPSEGLTASEAARLLTTTESPGKPQDAGQLLERLDEARFAGTTGDPALISEADQLLESWMRNKSRTGGRTR